MARTWQEHGKSMARAWQDHAKSRARASQEHRPLKDTYRELPLTGCHNSLLPVYRQPHLAFEAFPMLDGFGRHDASSYDAPYLPTKLPWRVDEHGAVDAVTGFNGRDLTSEAYRRDAERFALAFCRDARALHGHNHDHNCSFTCVK